MLLSRSRHLGWFDSDWRRNCLISSFGYVPGLHILVHYFPLAHALGGMERSLMDNNVLRCRAFSSLLVTPYGLPYRDSR